MVEKRKEKEDVQRKGVEDVVDYINLSLINIMSFVDNYTITLPQNKLEYYQKWENNDVFKKIHVDFELEKENRLLKQVSGGNPLEKYNEGDINTVIGVDGYLDQLHKEGIYHGDIISGEWDKKTKKYTGLKINVGNILKDDNGKIKLIDFGPINENEKRPHEKLMEIENDMLKQVREEGVTKTYSPERIHYTKLSASEKKRRREEDKKDDDDFMPGYGSDDSDDSYGSIPSPPKVPRRNNSKNVKGDPTVRSLFGGKKKRRRTKKKRKRKRKYTRRKKKRKRRRTKKKRRRRR